MCHRRSKESRIPKKPWIWLLTLLALGSSEACTRHPKIIVPSPISIQQCVKGNQQFVEAKKIHYVKKQETLFQISRIYGIPVERIAIANGIKDASRIFVGQAIVIPGNGYSHIIWPVRGKISSYFGKRESRGFHEGIDIVAPKGTPIKAAADGLVIGSGKELDGFSRYGRLVILDHGNGIRMIYAHNKKNYVRSGTCIRTGDVIGEVGNSGNATGSHLHFEIRKYGNPLNPILYLP
jgi:murein DD-endopeptidase MepM/ murein hydrolase activator NlpD